MNFSKLLNIYFIYLFVVWRRWSICKRRLLNVLNSIQFNSWTNPENSWTNPENSWTNPENSWTNSDDNSWTNSDDNSWTNSDDNS